MTEKSLNTLSKEERLCSKNAISELLAKGEFFGEGSIKFRYAKNMAGINRIMISVPKKVFKKAVIRNLLKRRIRESYRKQKSLLNMDSSVDILFIYGSKAILSYEEIYNNIRRILEQINRSLQEHDKEEK